ncbi:GGDEF-domain containing protein (plasmid) [Acetobacter orientalis]|uniref:GGDEF-domain containing protein n=1 Tax=Acetobacter orientalis TaxID=146474 RepID=A0A2Z5ZMS1_9PROT|nr:GGDEF-domain containing protein [Acetobacter orientalis]
MTDCIRTSGKNDCIISAKRLELQNLPAREADGFIRYALDCAAIVAVTDVRGTITFVNEKFCEINGYSRNELIGANHRILRSGVHDAEFFRSMYHQIANGRNWHGEICNKKKNGEIYWVDTTIVPHVAASGKVDSYTAIRFDITERKCVEAQLRESREHLEIVANLDVLTDLPNRRYFQSYLEKIIAKRAETGRSFFLALMDIDSFKEVNDSFGHEDGDRLLRTVGMRLRSMVDDHIFVARLGGDEFGVVFDETEEGLARAFFETILQMLREPIKIASVNWHASSSIGYATFPADGRDTTSLVRAADLALYRAKELGRDRVEEFYPELLLQSEKRTLALLEIETGLRREDFHFSYQPIIFRDKTYPVSFEALIRWHHPERGVIMPGDFQAGLTDPAMSALIGIYMLNRVFSDIKTMLEMGLSFRRVGINLTNADFRSDAFLEQFFSLCKQTGIGPEHFCVEVTEGMFLGREQKRVDRGLRKLHAAGVEIALDDFGTGYASLTHLQEIPIDRLKIDRRFVSRIITSSEDRVIVKGVIDIAHGLGKIVTAEGVETAEQAKMLIDMRCDSLQGWYFSKASDLMSLPSIMNKLSERRASLREDNS